MEIDSDNVAEIEKYAFLLGSAIKNEDTDQFFSIYDSILPKDLPDNQVEYRSKEHTSLSRNLANHATFLLYFVISWYSWTQMPVYSYSRMISYSNSYENEVAFRQDILYFHAL